MKRLLLLLIIILIILRILQQLFVRTNIKPIEEAIFDSNQSISQNLTFKQFQNIFACKIVNNSYKDKKNDNFGNVNMINIGNKRYVIDSTKKSSNRLITKAKSSFCQILNSIDVWINGLIYLRELALNLAKSTFHHVFDSSVSDVITGLVLGKQVGTIGSNITLFKTTGTQHLLAISGFHLNFFIMIVNKLYKKNVTKFVENCLNMLFASLFFCLIGYSPGLLRAFLMFGLSLLASQKQRQKKSIFVFFQAVLIAIIIDIQAIKSVGFQLSYVATFGLILFSILFKRLASQFEAFIIEFPRVIGNLWSYLFTSFLISLVAQIAIFPLVVYYFHEFSIIGIVATALVGWLIPIIMQLGFLFFVFQYMFPSNILFLISWPLFLVAKLLLILLELLSFNWAVITLKNFSQFHIFAYYAVVVIFLLLIVIYKQHKNIKKHDKIYHIYF
jgi:ComEC/Rec2-related protein